MDAAALTRTLTYIQANLDGDLSLPALAAVAGCSPPHFARRFAAMMAEPSKQYTSRLRLERAALRLVLLRDSILRVALDCGFSSHETFSRAFRRRFGAAPREFRVAGCPPPAEPPEIAQRVAAAEPTSLSNTVVRTLQRMSLAFLRHTGPYENVPIGLWDQLIEWARCRGATGPFVLLGIAHDAPGITADAKLRFDAAIRVPGEFRAGGRIGHQRLPGGEFALTTSVGPFDSLPAAYAEAFARMRRDRRWECLGVPCLEFYRVQRVSADVAIVETEIALPVRRKTRSAGGRRPARQ